MCEKINRTVSVYKVIKNETMFVSKSVNYV